MTVKVDPPFKWRYYPSRPLAYWSVREAFEVFRLLTSALRKVGCGVAMYGSCLKDEVLDLDAKKRDLDVVVFPLETLVALQDVRDCIATALNAAEVENPSVHYHNGDQLFAILFQLTDGRVVDVVLSGFQPELPIVMETANVAGIREKREEVA